MIRISHASKTIRGKTVLSDVTLSFQEGKCYLLQGANGSGKTMLLRLICGLIKESTGELEIPKDTSFGVIIENPAFMEHETGWENLRFLAKIRNKISEADIEAALKEVNLLEAKDKKVKTYSLGMKQRLAICQAIMEKPDVLLLDEPFNALDEKNCNALKGILQRRRDEGQIIIVAAHLVESTLSDLFDSVIVLSEGEVVSISDNVFSAG